MRSRAPHSGGPAVRPRIAIVGVGNVLMSDDGAGVRVAELLAAQPPAGVDVRVIGSATLDLVGLVSEYDRVVVVDAVRAGGAPGTVYRYEGDEIASVDDTQRFAHGTGVAEAIGLAERLGPRGDVVLLGIEPGFVGMSLELSRPVAAAMGSLLTLAYAEALGGCPTERGA
jgi:hydrogenase maturation protease